jgi:hypothetical protein
MPAIQPARLKAQVNQLVQYISEPKEFVRALHDLLTFYADRTQRAGRVGQSPAMLNSYRVHRPVLRQVDQALAPYIAADTETALSLADELWQEKWVETRLLAIGILGCISPTNPDVIIKRVEAWGTSSKEEVIINALVSQGIKRVRSEALDAFLVALENWLGSSETSSILVGLRATIQLLIEEEFENLPLLFRWVAPLVRNADLETKEDLVQILRIFAQRSPQETAYFLRQTLVSAASHQTAPVIRRTLEEFPSNLQVSLRQALRDSPD